MWLDKLKEMKRLAGKTSQQISDETGVPKSTIDKLFSGRTKEPYLSSTRLIVRCLGYTLDDLDDESEITPINLTDHEREVIVAYRKHIDMQKAIDRILLIDKANTVLLLKAARSQENKEPIGTMELTEEQFERLNNAPRVTDEDL